MRGRPVFIQGALILILGAIFFGSLIWAAKLFPKHYDWRRTVMSSLSSPRDNPQGYRIACAGLAFSGLLLLVFPSRLQSRFRPFAPRLALWAGRFLFLGAIGLFLAAVIVPGHYRILGIGRSHEHFAQIASVCFCVALILYFGALLRCSITPHWIRAFALVAVFLPVMALVVSRLILMLSFKFASDAAYHAIRASLWSSLALWEWTGAVSLYSFLALMTLMPEDEKPSSGISGP